MASLAGAQGTRGRRPGDAWPSHGDPFSAGTPFPQGPLFAGTPCLDPPVLYLPAPASRRAARLPLTEPFSKLSPAALCALETLHHGDAPRRAALGGMCGGVCVCVTPNPVPPIGGIACAPPSWKKDLAFFLEVGCPLCVTRPLPRSLPGWGGSPG